MSIKSCKELLIDEFDNRSELPVCERITSREASSLIKTMYSTDKSNQSNLLVITSDASRGANRHTGLASILREIRVQRGDDIVTTVTRRIQSISARDIFQSEVAAMALGMKTALQHIPIEKRQRVLLLTDSTSTISFFCGDEERMRSPSANFDHPHYKAMLSLLLDANQIYIAKVKSAKSGVDGFFDHDVADILSSFAKSVSNKKMEMICNSGTVPTNSNSFIRSPCNRLREDDLIYLERSTDLPNSDQLLIRKKQAFMKRDSGDRLERCRQRIELELGITLD